jgi:hypothetical protein
MRPVRRRLVAVDGSGASLAAAARTLTATLRREREGSGISSWDASGIFTGLEMKEGENGPSARTLTLLYAADLAFRIRWQIRPALDAGLSVVASPYVETAKSLAISSGLPRKWVQELFRFAPKPDSSYCALDRTSRTGGGANGDYVDRFVDTIWSTPRALDRGQLRQQSAAYLLALEKKGRCRRFK